MAIINPNNRHSWITIAKTTSEARNTTTTTTADSALQYTVIADATYLVECEVHHDVHSTGGFKYKFTLPSSVSFGLSRLTWGASGSTPVGATLPTLTSDITLTSPTGFSTLKFAGIYVVGVTGGTVSFDWAQSTSNGADQNVYRGSYMRFCRIL